jgi:hypothetical protein
MTNKKKEDAIALRADFGAVYLKTYQGQLMRPVRSKMTLKDKRGHFYTVKGKTAISSQGYRHVNKVASISIVTPTHVVVDGNKMPNPMIERSGMTKFVEAVAIRKIGIGFSPIGNLVVIDKTLFYNVHTYLIQSLQAKMKKDTRKNKCAVLGTQDDKPKEPKDAKWIFFEMTETGGIKLGIWANYADALIVDVIEEHTQRQKFGDRIAQSIVERNILRDHPAIAVSQVDVDQRTGQAQVDVYGWRNEMGPEDFQQVLQQAERGAQELEIKKEEIKVVPEEEEKEVIEAEAVADQEAPAEPDVDGSLFAEPPDEREETTDASKKR